MRAEVDALTLVNLAVGAALVVAARDASKWSAPSGRQAALVLLPLLAVGAVARTQVDAKNVAHHPVFTLLEDLAGRRPAATEGGPRLSLASLNAPRFGVDRTPPAEVAALASARAALARPGRTPNVILNVLESVGALQLLEDGLPAAKEAPFLRGLAARGVVLDSVYTTFPSTARSHVTLEMGGRTITLGSVHEELSYPSKAPSLPSAMKALGYRAGWFGSAGDLANENMERFHGDLGHDAFVHFATMPDAWKSAHRLDSWGGEESAFAKLAVEWTRAEKRPFFLTFVTNATHHPYSVPAGFAGPHPGSTDRERYRNALAYSDSVLRGLFEELEKAGALDDALVLVTGDHGESFEERHRGNLLHRNRIYDENVRTFLLVADGKRTAGPVLSHRVSSIGDVLPTLLGLLGAKADVPGQDLLAESYALRTVYFHKSVVPELWGLRDGAWKFIERPMGEPSPELYDLEKDPEERTNLAAAHPDMVAAYHERCAAWYLGTNREYVKHLVGFEQAGVKPIESVAEATTPGPKAIRFGRFEPDRVEGQRRFTSLGRVHPLEDLVVFIQWTNYQQDRKFVLEWTAPGAAPRTCDVPLPAGDDRTHIRLDQPLPLAAGAWRFRVLDGSRELIAEKLEVTSDAKLDAAPADRLPRITELLPGAHRVFQGREQFRSAPTLAPGERPAILARWAPRSTRAKLHVTWLSPSGASAATDLDLPAVKESIHGAPDSLPTASGEWRVTLSSSDGSPVGTATVRVP